MTGISVVVELVGGVALLLWAARLVRTGVERAYGGTLRRFLRRAAGSRLGASGLGLAVAALLQSSTATALLCTSFVERGLLSVGAGLALMLGADVGTTLVVQVLSFDLGALAPALLAVGVALFMLSGTARPRQIGRILVGLGLLLLSLELIARASTPVRDSSVLGEVLAALEGLSGISVLLGAALAWLAHSSVAVVLFLVSLASAGVIGGGLALDLVLGANAGSGLIALGLTARSPPRARAVPLGNLVFRIVGVLAVVGFVDRLAPLLAELEAEPARLLANFHTLFNLALALVWLPFVPLAARLLTRLMPEGEPGGERVRPRHLDESAIARPAVAISGAVREVSRLAELVEAMLRRVLSAFTTDDAREIRRLSELDDDVDRLQEAVKLYLARVSQGRLTEEQSRRCLDVITFAVNLEHVGDIIDKSLLELAEKRRRNALGFSQEGWEELGELHGALLEELQLAMTVFLTEDAEMARQLIVAKDDFRVRADFAAESHIERLRRGTLESIETSALHLDILRDFGRISFHLSRVAYPLLEARGEVRESRLVRHDAEHDVAEGARGHRRRP